MIHFRAYGNSKFCIFDICRGEEKAKPKVQKYAGKPESLEKEDEGFEKYSFKIWTLRVAKAEKSGKDEASHRLNLYIFKNHDGIKDGNKRPVHSLCSCVERVLIFLSVLFWIYR